MVTSVRNAIRESVRIALTCAALNRLDVCTTDVLNAHLQAPLSQKDFIVCELEFGEENLGKQALIKNALHGGKAAGRDFRNHLKVCMRHLKFEACLVDADMWMKPATESNGLEHCECTLLCVDDVLCISEMLRVFQDMKFSNASSQEESIGPPKLHLGGHMRKLTPGNGKISWAFVLSQCTRTTVQTVKDCVVKTSWKFLRAGTPISTR